MKKCKLLLSSLLIGLLVSTSCTERKDPSKDIVYDFSAYLDFPEDVTSGKNNKFNLKLSSDVYKDGALEHEASFSDNKNSFLISPKGDTIKAGEKFSIPHLDEPVFLNFYSDDLGEHNLKFTFKNSMGFTINRDVKLPINVGTFSFRIKQFSQEVTINTPAEITYSLEAYDQLKHSYKIKFEVEDNPKKLNATLSGHKAGEWFSTPNASKKLTYIPLDIGFHQVKITLKNDEGVEKSTQFTVESKGTGKPIIRSFSIDELKVSGIAGDLRGPIKHVRDHQISKFKWKLNAHSGNDKPFIKGKFTIKNLGGIEHCFEINNPLEQDLVYEYVINNYKLAEDFYVYNNTPIKYELELENSDGVKNIKQGSIVPKVDYQGGRNGTPIGPAHIPPTGGGFRR